MDLTNILVGALTNSQSVENLSGKTGLSQKQISSLIKIAVPVLIGYMTRNSRSDEGASSLLGALTQHNTEKPVAEQVKEADEEDGMKILGHILGGSGNDAVTKIADAAGVESSQAQSLLGNIAPILLSTLGTVTNQASQQKEQGFDLSDGFDLNDVIGILGGGSGESAAGDLIGSLLGASAPKEESNGTELLSALLKMMG